MKKISFLILFVLLIGFIFGFQNPVGKNNKEKNTINFNFPVSGMNPGVPDVMGRLNVLSSDGKESHSMTFQVDSFPNFAGWPKNISGTSFEGAIYCNMDADPEPEIVMAIGSMVYAWNMDGSGVPGWPKSLSYPAQGSPAFGDIDGDGQGEIVVGTASGNSNGFIYAFHKDGSTVTGFPINSGYTTRSIVLGDLDNNGRMEIITNKRLSNSGEIWVYKGDGTVYPGWPKTLNHVPASSSAVGDITGDGIPEIIAESYNSLYAYDRNGNLLPGFPFTMPNGDNNSYSSPVLADLDGDGKRDIIFGTHKLSGGGFVYGLKFDGTVLNGWPKAVSQWIYGPPAVGYIDNDNFLDVAVGDQVLSFSPTDYVYAWDRNGNSLPGFPIGPVNAVNDQILLADINNDNMTDLLFDDNTTNGSGYGKYLAFNHDGTPVNGWPITTTGTSFFYTPCLFDIDNNGTLDVFGGASTGSSSNLYLWNTGITYNPSRTYIHMWQYNTRHNGVFGDNGLVGITPVSSNIPYKYSLSQNYPNPFNPATIIKFDIPSSPLSFGEGLGVRLAVYDILGREVAALVNKQLKPGRYEISWDAINYPSGVYFYKLTAGNFTETKKMMLIK